MVATNICGTIKLSPTTKQSSAQFTQVVYIQPVQPNCRFIRHDLQALATASRSRANCFSFVVLCVFNSRENRATLVNCFCSSRKLQPLLKNSIQCLCFRKTIVSTLLVAAIQSLVSNVYRVAITRLSGSQVGQLGQGCASSN